MLKRLRGAMAGADLREPQRFEARQQAIPPRGGARCGLPVVVLAVCLAMGAVPAVFAEGAWRPADVGSLLNEETLEGALPGKAGAAGFGRVRPPLAFERNEGQTDGVVSFLARGRGYTLFLTGPEAVLRLRDADVAVGGEPVVGEGGVKPPRVLRMRLLGANPQPVMEGEQRLRGKVNYFIGNEPSLWRTNISRFGKVRYREVYPGIDLVYYGNEGQLEYDFVVAPGADPNRIAMAFEGAEEMRVDEGGDLLLKVGDREVRWQKPFIFQQVNGVRQEVVGTYRLLEGPRGDGLLTRAAGSLPGVYFELAAYDRALPLVIDPRLVYSTYLGGSGSDAAFDMALDAQGNVFLVGGTASIDFPTKAANTPTAPGGQGDVFVSRFDPAGELLFSTYLGGTGNEEAGYYKMNVALSGAGMCYVSGSTDSIDFPLVNPLQSSYGGGEYDGFIAGLSSDGSALLFSTYLGGESWDSVQDMAVGPEGEVFVVGFTRSVYFPITNAFQPKLSAPSNGAQYSDSFITRLEPGGKGFIYSTYYGRSATMEQASALAVDPSGNSYIALWVLDSNWRYQWLITKISENGKVRLFERRWPAAPTSQNMSLPSGIAVGLANNVVVAGDREVFGWTDAYVAQFNATDGNFLSEAYLGGSGHESVVGVCLGPAGDFIVVGSSVGQGYEASDFPVLDPIKGGPQPGRSVDVFAAKFRASDLRLTFSTLVGGPTNDVPYAVALDSNDKLWIAGATDGQFPIVDAFQAKEGGDRDAFLLQLSFGERIQISGSGQMIRLSWPRSASGFVLESATSPAAAAGEWTVVPQVPVQEGDQNVVTVEMGPSSQFFRLHQP